MKFDLDPQRIVKKNRFLERYQLVLAIGLVLAFFTYLDVYLYGAGLAPPPKLWVIGFVVASFPILFIFVQDVKNLFACFPILAWIVIYLTTSWISILQNNQSEIAVQEFENRFLAMLFFLTAIAIFFNNPRVQKVARMTISIVSIVNVFNNIHELLHPLVFHALNLTGRPAGWYINPNTAGCALILGLIFGIGIFPNAYRIPFVLILGLGIICTFSRGSILSWFLVNFIFLLARIIPRNHFFVWAIGLGIGLIALIFIGGSFLDLEQLERAGILNKNIMGRLVWFQDPSSAEADADTSRVDIISFAIQKASQHPLIGNGIGYTQFWGDIPPHNMYLLFSVEHGLPFVLMYPALFYFLIQGSRGETSIIGLNFFAFLLFWALFSHNILEQRFFLTVFALMNAMKCQCFTLTDTLNLYKKTREQNARTTV
jgi:O-Antigen ligase